MKYLRAWAMRRFGLVSRERLDETLRAYDRVFADRSRAIHDLREAYDQIESLSASLKAFKAQHSRMAMRITLNDLSRN
jgi:hypothetical protein